MESSQQSLKTIAISNTEVWNKSCLFENRVFEIRKNLRVKILKNSMESAKEISAKVEKDRLEEALEFYRWLPISPYGGLNSSRNIALNEALKGKEKGVRKGLDSIQREGKMEVILQAMVIGAFLLIIMWLFSIPFLPL